MAVISTKVSPLTPQASALLSPHFVQPPIPYSLSPLSASLPSYYPGRGYCITFTPRATPSLQRRESIRQAMRWTARQMALPPGTRTCLPRLVCWGVGGSKDTTCLARVLGGNWSKLQRIKQLRHQASNMRQSDLSSRPWTSLPTEARVSLLEALFSLMCFLSNLVCSKGLPDWRIISQL